MSEGEIYGTVGTNTADGNIVLCGGFSNNSVKTTCYIFSSNSWSKIPPMIQGRVGAAAGWVDGEWMVTGGSNGEVGGWLSSTEVLKAHSMQSNLEPVMVTHHCRDLDDG